MECGGKPFKKSKDESETLFVNRYLLAFKNLLRSIESTGSASVYGVNYFGKGILNGSNYVTYITHDALAKDLLNGTFNYVPSMKAIYKRLTSAMVNYGAIQH